MDGTWDGRTNGVVGRVGDETLEVGPTPHVILCHQLGSLRVVVSTVETHEREIGIRRAVGASPGKIRGQILTESVFLTIIAGMGGIAFGAFLIYILNYVLDMTDPIDMFANPSVDLRVIITALVILIVSGLLAGLIPAQNAIKLKPVEALRTE